MILARLRNFLAAHPALFTLTRKVIELNFRKQKRQIRNSINGRQGMRVLDIGCGTGEFSRLFAQQEYYGIDISPDYINFASRHRRGAFAVMDATKLGFPDNHFDFVLIMALLHHLSDGQARCVIHEAMRVLKPNGTILIMEDAHIPELANALVRLVQRYDLGDYIRSPKEYRALWGASVTPVNELSFRNGGCVYYVLQGQKTINT